MRVMCINKNPLPNKMNLDLHLLEEGEDYEVINMTHNNRTGSIGYILSEVHSDNPAGFASERFIPLSSIDETEMIREYQTEKV